MLCHRSRPKEGVSIPCARAILVNGMASIGLPIAATAGQIEVGEYGGGAALYASFADMLRANGIEPPPRNRWTRR